MDAPAALKTIATRELAFTDPGSIFLDGKNVLSIVVAMIVPGLLASARAESPTRSSTPAKERKVVRGPSTSMSLSRSAKITLSPVASRSFPPTSTLRAAATKASRFSAISSLAAGLAVTAASRPGRQHLRIEKPIVCAAARGRERIR